MAMSHVRLFRRRVEMATEPLAVRRSSGECITQTFSRGFPVVIDKRAIGRKLVLRLQISAVAISEPRVPFLAITG